MPGMPQSLGGEELGGAQTENGVEERDMGHAAIVPSDGSRTSSSPAEWL
jgi:hypothetical protein